MEPGAIDKVQWKKIFNVCLKTYSGIRTPNTGAETREWTRLTRATESNSLRA